MNKKIFVLMGASGAGKTKLGQYLKENGVPKIISHTTRPIRSKDGEVHGVTYYYVDREEFKKIDKVEFVEYAGEYYCISRNEIEAKLSASDVAFVICEKNGMEQIKKKYPKETIVIFISAPSIEELKRRMRNRGDTEESIALRIQKAEENRELENGGFADYTVFNNDIEDAKKQMLSILNYSKGDSGK